MAQRPLFIATLLLALMLAWLLPAYGGIPQGGPQQTWPSRTPTSSSPQKPTEPPTDGGGDLGPTGVPGQFPTATAASTTGNLPQPATTAPSETFILVPTALPCQSPPTAMALGKVTVRSGPGINYEIIGALNFSEVRIIVGRSFDSPWWQIQLTPNDKGWVSDQAVTIQGFTETLPLVEPPPILGKTPTPGSPWEPTPNPLCIQVTAAEPMTSTQPAGTAVPLDAGEEEVPVQLVTEVSPTMPAESASGEISEDPDEPPVTSEPTEVTTESGDLNWLLLGGVLFIIAGAIVYLVQRR